MVEGVSMPPPAPQSLPSPKTGPPITCGLPAAHHTAKDKWLVDCPTLSGGIGVEGLPSPEGFPQNL